MRLRNRETGVVVNVGDAEAETMTARDWEPVDRKAPEPLPTRSRPRRRRKSESESDE